MFSRVIEFIRSLYPGRDIIPLHEPCFTGREKEYVNSAIDSTFVSSAGRFVDLFEKMICEITGARFSVATVNGTSALHMALKLAGVQSGDEVITQPLCFVATANAISYCGAKPVFLDVDRETLGLCPMSLEGFLKEHTDQKDGVCHNKTTGNRVAACVPMHTFGHPCRIDEIARICDAYHVALVEDAAESIGSTYKKRHLGTFGLTGIFSFNGNKTVTCGGGGAIITDDEGLAVFGRHLATTGKKPHPYEYIHDVVGYNYRLPNINAALACAQLERLGFFVDRKRGLAQRYKEFFDTMGIPFIGEPEHARSNYWLNAILLSDREERDLFLEKTNEAGIRTRPVWRLLSSLEMYKDCFTDALTRARWLEDRLVNIPSSVQ